MAGVRRDIAEVEQIALVDGGIELRLALHVGEVARPAHEMRDRARWPIAIEHFEPETLRRELALRGRERNRGLPCQKTARRLVAVDPGADEVVVSEIAHVDDELLNYGRRIDK